MRFGIIGGTGVDEMAGFQSAQAEVIDTGFGRAQVVECELDGREMVFVPRHGVEHNLLPSQINYRAQIAALRRLGVDRVIGVSAVGSLVASLPTGSFAVLDDFIDMTKCRQSTFYDQPDSPVVHTDFTHPYCPAVSDALREACEDERLVLEPRATYVAVEGPRYETPAEIKLYASWGGHVVGMTNVPEAVLAREAGLCYGAVAIIANLACGLAQSPLSHEEVRAAVRSAGDRLGAVLRKTIRLIPSERACHCALAGAQFPG